MRQVLKTISELLESSDRVFTSDDLANLDSESRDYLLTSEILVPTRLAKHVTCDACAGDHVEEVVTVRPNGMVEFRIPCPEAGWIPVDEIRLRQWTIDLRQLVSTLSAAVDHNAEPEEWERNEIWELASIDIADESFVVVFAIGSLRNSDSIIDNIRKRHPLARTILITNSLPELNELGLAAASAISNAFEATNTGLGFAENRIRSILNVGSDSNANQFRKSGQRWLVSFEGESTDLNDIDGLRYIACLLREPNRVLPVPVLNEIVTGVSADVLKSNSESYSTEEAMAQLRDRIDQLGRDRQTANENNDDSWKKRIDAEVEQIENDFGYNQGLGGKLRQRSEFTKAKRKIAENIRRGLMVIKEHHNGLWSHLDNSIKTSGGFRYEPDREIDWLT